MVTQSYVQTIIIILIIVTVKKKKIEWIIHSIYEVKKFHSLRSEFHSILNSSRVNIHYSTNGISSGSLDIHSKGCDHWRHYPGSGVSDK